MGGIAGRDGSDGVGLIPGIVRLDGASSRLKRRKWHWSFPYLSMQGGLNIYFLDMHTIFILGALDLKNRNRTLFAASRSSNEDIGRDYDTDLDVIVFRQ